MIIVTSKKMFFFSFYKKAKQDNPFLKRYDQCGHSLDFIHSTLPYHTNMTHLSFFKIQPVCP